MGLTILSVFANIPTLCMIQLLKSAQNAEFVIDSIPLGLVLVAANITNTKQYLRPVRREFNKENQWTI